jgi:rhomboid protease GluP
MNAHTIELYASAAVVFATGKELLVVLAPTLPDRRSPVQVLGAAWARRPRVTAAVLVATAVMVVLQYAVAGLAGDLVRRPGALGDGQEWRMFTALFIQSSGAVQIVVNLSALLGAGAVAEWVLGPRRWLLVYFASGLVANYVSLEGWGRHGGGCSVAICGLVGALAAITLLRGAEPGDTAQRLRLLSLAVPATGLFLCLLHNNHGAGLLTGFVLGAVIAVTARPGALRLGLGKAPVAQEAAA